MSDRRVPASAREQGVEQIPDHRLTGNFPVALVLGGDGLAKGQAAPDPLLPLPSTTVSLKGQAARRWRHCPGGWRHRCWQQFGVHRRKQYRQGQHRHDQGWPGPVQAVKNSALSGRGTLAPDFRLKLRMPETIKAWQPGQGGEEQHPVRQRDRCA
jgi:hypothetical protein